MGAYYWAYSLVDPLLLGIYHFQPFFLFHYLCNASLSGQSWRPEIYRPKDLRGGDFSIRLKKPISNYIYTNCSICSQSWCIQPAVIKTNKLSLCGSLKVHNWESKFGMTPLVHVGSKLLKITAFTWTHFPLDQH